MHKKYSICQVLFIAVIIISRAYSDKNRRHKYKHHDKTLWKKEYEDELIDATLSSKKRENITRVTQYTGKTDNEIVIEKIMDSITSSEKYLKKVNSIDFRLNRLDIEVHEKTNNILKLLTEIMKTIHDDSYAEKLGIELGELKTDLNEVKSIIAKTQKVNSKNPVESRNHSVDSALDSRLTYLDNDIKTIMTGVESIASIISEVQNRPYSRSFTRPDISGGGMDAAALINEFRKVIHEQKNRKCDCKLGRVDRSERYPTDCHEIQMQGFNVSGIYKIKPDDMEPFYVLCDLTTAGGGWTVFQNRFDGSQDFFKGWIDYKYGFGNLAGEFWLGLEKISYLTNQKLYELRIEVETQHDLEAYADYSVFTVGPEHEGFRISSLGTFYGTAGDSLSYHAGQKFSTPDVDNDEWKDGSCAVEHGGAWWHKDCDKSNLNGKYTTMVDDNQSQSIFWITFKDSKYPLTKTKMMIRPLPASKPLDYNLNRNRLESPKSKSMSEMMHSKEGKRTYGINRGHPYRFDDRDRGEAFFPNYA